MDKDFDENNQLTFSDLLYNVIYSQTIDMAELISLFSREIETRDEQKVSVDGTATAITPGTPIIELVASEQSKKWIELADTFEKDGLDKLFSGIIINGRVSLK